MPPWPYIPPTIGGAPLALVRADWTKSGAGFADPPPSAHGVNRARWQRQRRLLGADVGGPHNGDVLARILHDNRGRALVLAGHRRAGRIKLHAVALNGAPGWDVDVERGLADGFGIEATILLLGNGEDVVEQQPSLVEAHRTMGWHVGCAGLGLVALDHGRYQIAQTRSQRLRLEELGRHR